MSITIHVNPGSQHARRVRVAALELGLTIDWRPVDFGAGAHKAPAYLALNPNGKVPVLEDDGFVLWESNAIMAYLADLAPAAGLYPTEARARADVNRWLFWESAHFGRACIALTFERMVKPLFYKQPTDEALAAAGEREWHRYAAVLDAHLASREHVAAALSIADFALASILMYRGPAGIDTAPYPHLEAWLARIEARPSWQATAPAR